jgi:uncharacterized protein (TIGR02246 family)
MKYILISLITAASLLLMWSCTKRTSDDDKREVTAALQRYDRLIQTVNADSIALLYMPNGEIIGNGKTAAIGRDSIRAFLSTFRNVRVPSNISTVSDISITADTAVQRGSYKQVAIIGGHDTVRVKGDFTATWQRDAKGQWLLRRMATVY